MDKVSVRCYIGFAVIGMRHNIEVYYTMPDFGYCMCLFTDLRTGEIYAIDTSHNNISENGLNDLTEDLLCPVTGRLLKDNLVLYPNSFLFEDQIGHFCVDSHIPDDSKSIIREFWEIKLPMF